jgi:hypothetical protein
MVSNRNSSAAVALQHNQYSILSITRLIFMVRDIEQLPPESVVCVFGVKSLSVRILGKHGSFSGTVPDTVTDASSPVDTMLTMPSLRFEAKELWGEIQPDKAEVQVKKGKLAITLRKGHENRAWERIR